MNQQTSFTDYEYDNRSRRTRREQFLTSMDEMIPWQDWVGMIEPYYSGNKKYPIIRQQNN